MYSSPFCYCAQSKAAYDRVADSNRIAMPHQRDTNTREIVSIRKENLCSLPVVEGTDNTELLTFIRRVEQKVARIKCRGDRRFRRLRLVSGRGEAEGRSRLGVSSNAIMRPYARLFSRS